jgi:CRISPR system Cascade subunit CasE
MYLSYLLIDAGENPDRPRPGRLWLRNLYRVHQRLCMAFPNVEHKTADPYFIRRYEPQHFQRAHVHERRSVDGGFLFRIDPLPAGRTGIVIQSVAKPDWNYAFQNASFLAAPPQVYPYEPQFRVGQLLKFRLLANATRRNNDAGNKYYGKRVPVKRENLEKWLKNHAEKAGFVVEKLLNIQTDYASAAKNKDDESKRFFFARYDGVLKVTDANLLWDAVIRGIGPAKGFGFGLLSILPMKD